MGLELKFSGDFYLGDSEAVANWPDDLPSKGNMRVELAEFNNFTIPGQIGRDYSLVCSYENLVKSRDIAIVEPSRIGKVDEGILSAALLHLGVLSGVEMVFYVPSEFEKSFNADHRRLLVGDRSGINKYGINERFLLEPVPLRFCSNEYALKSSEGRILPRKLRIA
jgi:hypothetical protein